jgi:berberine-like enzyme
MNGPSTTDNRMSTRNASQNIGPDDPRYSELVRRGFNKLKRRLSDRLAGVVYRALTRADAPGGFIGLATYGGRVNTVASDATAASQRGWVIDSAYAVGWMDPAQEAPGLAWVRDLYGEVFAELGGVPAPGAETEGALITHPDDDLADPAWNTSRVPWHWMYYLGNYGRLQQVKARWDPRNVFRHVLSVQAPDR